VWHYSILDAGLAVTPGPLVVAFVSGPAGKLAGRYGFRRILMVGFGVFTLGLVWYVIRLGLTPEYLKIWLPGTLIVGLGIGLTFPVLSAAAVSSRALRRGQRRQSNGPTGRRRVGRGDPRGNPGHADQCHRGAR
jgi:NTE family protein